MSARCGEGRDINCSAVMRGSGREIGIDRGPKGVVFVGALLMKSVMRKLTFIGVTFSIMMKAGRRRTVVGSSYFVECDGVGILEAESMSFCWKISRFQDYWG